jgi:hypothetical protein
MAIADDLKHPHDRGEKPKGRHFSQNEDVRVGQLGFYQHSIISKAVASMTHRTYAAGGNSKPKYIKKEKKSDNQEIN